MYVEKDEIGENDLPRVRYIETTDKQFRDNKIVLTLTDPYGFWRVHFERGLLPEELKGCFTSVYEAEKAVYGWMKTKKKEIKVDDSSS